MENFDREDFMDLKSMDKQQFDLNFGNEDQRKLREEMRAEN